MGVETHYIITCAFVGIMYLKKALRIC